MRAAGDVAESTAALLGGGLATYTGVLIGVTTIPVWAANARLLPFRVLSGPAVLTIRMLADERGGRRLAALSAIAGLLTRFAWIEASKASAQLRRRLKPLSGRPRWSVIPPQASGRAAGTRSAVFGSRETVRLLRQKRRGSQRGGGPDAGGATSATVA